MFKSKKQQSPASANVESSPLSVFPLPTLSSGMTDHILSHRKGSEFQYVTLAHSSKESKFDLFNRIRSSNPKIRKEEIPIDDLPILRLIDEEMRFPLSSALKAKKIKDYILLKEAILHYVPLESFHDTHSTLQVSLHDMRRDSDNTMVRSSSSNGNITITVRFSLDFCVPKDSIDKLEVRFNYKNPNFTPGNQWGSVKASISLLQMDFPTQTDVTETVGIMSMPGSAFNKPDRDPRHFNAVLDGSDLDALVQLHSGNMIIDSSKPAESQPKPITYAGTSFAGPSRQTKFISSDDGLEDDVGSVANSAIGKWQARINSPKLVKTVRMIEANDDEEEEEEEVIVPEGPATAIYSTI